MTKISNLWRYPKAMWSKGSLRVRRRLSKVLKACCNGLGKGTGIYGIGQAVRLSVLGPMVFVTGSGIGFKQGPLWVL